jgi:hypothetical protein
MRFFTVAAHSVGLWVLLSAATAKNRVSNANWGPKRRYCHAPTADSSSTADGTRRSTGDTQKMGESAGTARGEALAYSCRLLPGTPPPAALAMGWSTVAVEYH